MHIRAAASGDIEDIMAVDRAAFDTAVESELSRALMNDSSYATDFSLVALDDGRLVGHSLVSRLALDAPDGSTTELLSLAPVAVDPDSQGHGIGTMLILESIRRARAAGERAIVVLGYPDYYPRMGFVEAAPYGIEPPAGWDVPSEAWMLLELRPGALEGVSGVVRYPTAFEVVA